MKFICTALFAALALICTTSGLGDEPKAHIHFKEKAEVGSRLVLLGDVAEIDSADADLADKLAQTELIAAPSAGQVRSVRQREWIDHVQLNGFSLQHIEFSGAALTQVSVGAASRVKAAAPTSGRLAAAHRRIKQVVAAYLRTAQPEARRAAIEIQCDAACSTAASATASTISVVDAREAAGDTYEVIVAIASHGEVEEFAVTANITQSNRVVVASRSLKQGSVLTAADLKLGPARSEVEQASAASSVDDLIGQELTRSIGADQIIPLDQVVRPRLIRKGDLVEVTARVGGVRVTTQAIAQQDGAMGESIALEAIDGKTRIGQKNKETIRAQVVAQGAAQIEVAGRSAPSPRIGPEPKRLGSTVSRANLR
jgi:flagella basal body P-ring formation protein FlgA